MLITLLQRSIISNVCISINIFKYVIVNWLYGVTSLDISVIIKLTCKTNLLNL